MALIRIAYQQRRTPFHTMSFATTWAIPYGLPPAEGHPVDLDLLRLYPRADHTPPGRGDQGSPPNSHAPYRHWSGMAKPEGLLTTRAPPER